MPKNGGKCRNCSKDTAVAIVQMNKPQITKAPRFIGTSKSVPACGFSSGTAKLINVAGTIKFTTDGRNKAKNSKNVAWPLCQTIRVVMSPNGLKAPPALAATTILMQPRATNFGLSEPTANTTAPINSAVVKLSAIGERKKANTPVIQNSFR